MEINLYAAWIGFLFGALSGAVAGLFFHREQWLGGYDSWPRRMTRLGHISFFGIGILNVLFVTSARALDLSTGMEVPGVLLIVAAVSMPLICYISAFWRFARHFFFIPVLSLTGAILLFLWRILP